ncbi:MAG: V-type ATP synthase subunit F [Christensenellaceae bacterium]|jgi:V/A-type H+-transporting ATPase subunit F|nr:V-type ATP synthase subunit F [Christensenellaceae bacterium]
MPNERIAVIGDKDGVLAFKAIGIDVFDSKNFFDARETLKRLARDYSIILITEDIAESIADTVARYKARPYPIILPIPSVMGTTGFGMQGLSIAVEKAIGSDILFNGSSSQRKKDKKVKSTDDNLNYQ